MGTNFQNFVNFDNIATEKDTGTDGDWEKDCLEETRNIHESGHTGMTTDNDIDEDDESDVEIDNELPVKK